MPDRLYHEAHYGEEEAIDKEWEEFAKQVELRNKRLEEQRNTFYPSPQQEEDYESTIVSPKTKALASFKYKRRDWRPGGLTMFNNNTTGLIAL